MGLGPCIVYLPLMSIYFSASLISANVGGSVKPISPAVFGTSSPVSSEPAMFTKPIGGIAMVLLYFLKDSGERPELRRELLLLLAGLLFLLLLCVELPSPSRSLSFFYILAIFSFTILA